MVVRQSCVDSHTMFSTIGRLRSSLHQVDALDGDIQILNLDASPDVQPVCFIVFLD